jgi:hypothetical protein
MFPGSYFSGSYFSPDYWSGTGGEQPILIKPSAFASTSEDEYVNVFASTSEAIAE